MTIDDAFDARLKAAFAAQEPPADEAFEQRIDAGLDKVARRRLLVVGGAGAVGAAIAVTQIMPAFERIRSWAAAAGLGDAGGNAYVQPQMIAVLAVAAVMSALAVFLTARS